jgi:hypothetical protein
MVYEAKQSKFPYGRPKAANAGEVRLAEPAGPSGRSLLRLEPDFVAQLLQPLDQQAFDFLFVQVAEIITTYSGFHLSEKT